ncbi:ATP/GTP-binding protein, partial [Streptomyces sp. DSM 40712]|nr:ATP/GTP-binding protein [Streptomyces sp. DSM 40712]
MTQRGRPLFPGATSPGPGQFASVSPSGTPADVPVAADGGTAAPAERTPAVLPGAPRAAGRAALGDRATERSQRADRSARSAPENQ